MVVESILGSLTHILNKAEKLRDHSNLLAARLRDDMYPLIEQVRHIAQFSESSRNIYWPEACNF